MFNYKRLVLAMASIISMLGFSGVAHSAGLDRSGQDITAFLQDGTYGEVVYTYIDADVSGVDKSGKTVGDMAEAYDFGRFGVKADINDTFSVGVLYDEPFGAAVQYRGDNDFVSGGANATITALTGRSMTALNTPIPSAPYNGATAIQAAQAAMALKPLVESGNATPAQTEQYRQASSLLSAVSVAQNAETQKGQGTNVEIRTQNATLLLGAKLGQNKNFQVYGGPALQRLTGEVHLRGTTYSGLNGYDANIGADTSTGWVAGVAYHKPEIALKASLTYRSEIEHARPISEIVPATGYHASRDDFKVSLPESWNLDFQTGVNPTTLLTAKVRYVPWSDFSITPPQYSDTVARVNNGKGLPIVRYSDDQWSAEVGLGKKLNDKFSVQGSVGYDTGAGDPVSTLGPIDGYYSVGLGGKYNITPEWSLSLGAKYFMFGDATVQIPTQVGTDQNSGHFKDNDGYAVGVKLAYQKK